MSSFIWRHFTEQFENAVVTFEMEKTLSRRGKGTSKADYSEKEEEENIVRRRKPQNSGTSINV